MVHLRYLGIWVALLLPIFAIELYSVPIYRNGFSNPVSMGMGSLGTGLRQEKSALYANPGYLKKKQKKYFDLGAQGASYGDQNSPILPGGSGFYWSDRDSNWGFWGIYSPLYTSHLPDRENIYLIQGNLGATYSLSEDIHFSLGLGVGGLHRFRSTSNWSASGRAHLYGEWGKWSWGVGIELPGIYSREDYLGGEELEERTPERLSTGVGYEFWDSFGFYGEVRKIFWERKEIYRNGIEDTPDWERGLGAEWGISGGIYGDHLLETNWNLRTGWEWGGAYSREGKNHRYLGLAIGVGYDWELDKGEKISLDVGILDTAITALKGFPFPGTQYSLSLSYSFL